MADAKGNQHLPSYLFMMSVILLISCAMGECPDTMDDRYQPVIPPSQMTPVSVNLAFITSLKGEAKFFGGAFFLAVDQLNEDARNQSIPVNFTWSFHDTDNSEVMSMKVMADLYCQKKINVFIGPDNFCRSAGVMATAYSIPYMTFECADGGGAKDTKRYQMVNTKFYFGYSAIYLVEVLRHFGWTSAWIIRGPAFKWVNTASLLLDKMHKAQITVNGDTTEVLNDQYSPSRQSEGKGYIDFIEKTKDRTRVYIFLGKFESLILFARQLKDKISNPEEYVVLAADASGNDHSRINSTLYFYEQSPVNNSAPPQNASEAFHNVLILSPLDFEQKDEKLVHFLDRVWKRDLEPPLGLPTAPPAVRKFMKPEEEKPKIPLTAFTLYDTTVMYGRAVMALMAVPDMDPLSSTNIIEWLRCRAHDSIRGRKMYIHDDGRSENGFILYGSAHKVGKSENHMWRVGDFLHNGSSITYRHLQNVTWIGGQIPVSNPKCGFANQLCRNQQSKTRENWIIIGAVIAFLVICLLAGSFLIRKYLDYQENKKMRWKIDESEIEYPSADEVKEMLTPARSRKRKISNNLLQSFYLAQNQEPDVISSGTQDQHHKAIPMVMYKGNRVFEKRLNCKDLELPRPLLSQLKLLKDMSHENINEFKGACINPPILRIFTQFCPRRSLQDILQKDDLPLHDMFTTSIVQDLINGMGYIHDSKLVFHGNLKSSNCLVDSRWTVKISDFGLNATRPTRAHQQDEEDVSPCIELLWTAPELLPMYVCPSCESSRNNSSSDPNLAASLPTRSLLNHSTSNSSSTSNNGGKCGAARKDSKFFGLTQGKEKCTVATGTQKGDVYSFAIILYELYGHAGPWGNTGMSPREIVYGLLNQRSPTPRPDINCLKQAKCDDRVVKLIEACWDDNPDLRPDFKTGIRIKFQPIQQLLLSPNIIDNMLAKMEKYTDDLEVMVEERTDELKREKKMTDNLLLRMLPRSVAERLKRGQPVTPEQYEQVTIYFSDIVGFTEMSADSTPMEVVDLLNDLYTCFDTIIEKFDVYKVETIGDAYMVVSGLPMRNGDRHAGEIASMALELLDEIRMRQFKIRGRENNTLKIRIGIHSGPCCAGVVGKKMPRYCLFGDTINTASRLETTGEALKVHVSEDCKLILDKLGGYHLKERGLTPMKGKGSLMTYFLVSEDHIHRQRRIQLIQKSDEPWRCVSASNIDYSGQFNPVGSSNSVRRHGTSSGNMLSFPPLVAAKDASSKSLTRITLPLLSSKTAQNDHRRSFNSSTDSSTTNGSWPMVPQTQGGDNADNGSATPNSSAAFSKEFQFLPCTSPRAHGQRHSSFMSPIAEDPQPLPGSAASVRYGSDSGSASMESNTSPSHLPIPVRDRIFSEPGPTLNNSTGDGVHSHLGTSPAQNRYSANCPATPGIGPLNASFDHDRSASEPPVDWATRSREPVLSIDTYSPTNLTSTSSSFPSIRLNDDETQEPDSPFSPDANPSETDSLLESSWASSNHPFVRIDSIPVKPTPNTNTHDLQEYDAHAAQDSGDHSFKNSSYFAESNSTDTKAMNAKLSTCDETIL